MLKVRSLDAFYGRAQVTFGVDVDLARGEAVALLGRNGAGKSTVLKAVMGLVRTTAREIEFDGGSLQGLPPYRACRRGLGYVPEERRIFTDLTVAENLEVACRPPREGLPPWTIEALIKLFPNLAEILGRRAAYISGGEQQMLAIARTLMGNPVLLLLDEPAEGLAPRIAEDLAERIADLKDHGLTLLLSEQNLDFAAQVADRAIVMETGRVRWSGTMAALAPGGDGPRHLLTA